jgi:ZIP family zinc transporter
MLLGAALGVLFVILLSRLLPRGASVPELELPEMLPEDRVLALRRTGFLLSAGIAIHNLPEGIAIGSGMALPGTFGLELALLIFAHNIPEGMAMSLPLRLAGTKKSRILLLGLLVGAPTAVGAWIGAYLGAISHTVVGVCLGFAGGAMLYLTLKELIPETVRMRNSPVAAVSIAIGIAAGAALAYAI